MAVQPLNQSTPFAGLGTSTFTAAAAGEYTVRVTSTLPLGSELQTVVKYNGFPVYIIGGGSVNHGPSLAGEFTQQCAPGDTLSVVLSSNLALDALPNAVTSTINIFLAP